MGDPVGLCLEKPERLHVSRRRDGEAVVQLRGQDKQVPPVKLDTHPQVLRCPHVKVPGPVQDVPDLLVVVQVFHKELVQESVQFPTAAQGRVAEVDNVSVHVPAFSSEGVHHLLVAVSVQDPDLVEFLQWTVSPTVWSCLVLVVLLVVVCKHEEQQQQ